MNIIIEDSEYSYVAATKVITLAAPYDSLSIGQIISIKDMTTGSLFYDTKTQKYPITISGADVTHTYDDDNDADADDFQIIIDIGGSSSIPIYASITGAVSIDNLKLTINEETLSANKTLVATDYVTQWLDPNGSDRDITLPAEADSTDLFFIILNTANAKEEDLVIKTDAPATITTIGPNQAAILACNGTTWKLENDLGIYYDGQAAVNEMGYKVTGSMVVTDYFTVGQSTLYTAIPFFVNGNGYMSGYIRGGNLYTNFPTDYFGTVDNLAKTGINIPVISGTSPHSISLQIDSNDIITVRGTGDGAGGVTDLIALLDQNDMWLAEKSYAGNYINLLKVNVDDEIDVGGSMNLGTIEGPEDGGYIKLADMPVSAAAVANSKQGFALGIDGDNCLSFGAFADGVGGVGGHFLQNHGAHFDKKTDMGANSYAPSALTSDYIVTVDTTGAARTVVISTEDRDTGSAAAPRIFVISDIAGNAGANNITVSLETAGNINGAGTYVIAANYGSITLYIDGTDGIVI